VHQRLIHQDVFVQYREEEPVFSGWSDEQIIENVITKFAEDDEI